MLQRLSSNNSNDKQQIQRTRLVLDSLTWHALARHGAYNFSKFITCRTVRICVTFPFVEMCTCACLCVSDLMEHMNAYSFVNVFVCEYSVLLHQQFVGEWLLTMWIFKSFACMSTKWNAHGNCVWTENEENKSQCENQLATTDLFTFAEHLFVINYLDQYLKHLVNSPFDDTREYSIWNRGFSNSTWKIETMHTFLFPSFQIEMWEKIDSRFVDRNIIGSNWLC